MGLREEWLKALEAIEIADDNPDAYTASQLAQLWNCSVKTASKKALKLVSLGKATTVKKRLKTGVYQAYLLSLPAKKHK